MFKKIALTMLVIALAVMLGACASTEYVKDISPVAQPVQVVKEVKAEVVTAPVIAPPEAVPAAKVEEVPKVAVIKGKVLFAFDSFELDAETKLALDKIAVEMEEAPGTCLVLKGHTDKVGSNEYNQILSEDRADAVENYLCEAGVPANRIVSVEGFGKTLLLPDLSDQENRRVTILSVEK